MNLSVSTKSPHPAPKPAVPKRSRCLQNAHKSRDELGRLSVALGWVKSSASLSSAATRVFWSGFRVAVRTWAISEAEAMVVGNEKEAQLASHEARARRVSYVTSI